MQLGDYGDGLKMPTSEELPRFVKLIKGKSLKYDKLADNSIVKTTNTKLPNKVEKVIDAGMAGDGDNKNNGNLGARPSGSNDKLKF